MSDGVTDLTEDGEESGSSGKEKKVKAPKETKAKREKASKEKEKASISKLKIFLSRRKQVKYSRTSDGDCCIVCCHGEFFFVVGIHIQHGH